MKKATEQTSALDLITSKGGLETEQIIIDPERLAGRKYWVERDTYTPNYHLNFTIDGEGLWFFRNAATKTSLIRARLKKNAKNKQPHYENVPLNVLIGQEFYIDRLVLSVWHSEFKGRKFIKYYIEEMDVTIPEIKVGDLL